MRAGYQPKKTPVNTQTRNDSTIEKVETAVFVPKRAMTFEARMPSMGYTDLLPKTHLGVNGALFLIEQVLNGLMSKI